MEDMMQVIGITEKRALEIMFNMAFSQDAVENRQNESKEIRLWHDMFYRLLGKYKEKGHVEHDVTYKWEE